MSRESPIAVLSRLGASSLGVFRGRAAAKLGVSRNQLARLRKAGVIERELPDTYRMTAVARSSEQSLRAALLWAGDDGAAAGRSAGAWYRLEGIRAPRAEIAIPKASGLRSTTVAIHRYPDPVPLTIRRHKGLKTTGIEATLLALASVLDDEAFEVACEDARRRRLTSVPALQSYLDRFGRAGRPGVSEMRRLLRELDPDQASRSTLEVKTRRLLVANGVSPFVREFPLEWHGRTHRFDFGFPERRTILETNGRRWHDDPNDYEHDNDKWSVPGRHGYRLVLATWAKVTRRPADLLEELSVTLGM